MNINFKIKEKTEQVYFDIFIITKKRKINFAFEDSSDEEIEKESDEVIPKLSTDELKNKGDEFAEAGDYMTALKYWRHAIDISPDLYKIHESMAQVLLELGETFEAIKEATKAVEIAPTWGEGFITLARCQRNFGEIELCLKSFETGLSLIENASEYENEIQEIRDLIRIRDMYAEEDESVKYRRCVVKDEIF